MGIFWGYIGKIENNKMEATIYGLGLGLYEDYVGKAIRDKLETRRIF